MSDATEAWEKYANRRHMHSHARIPSKDFLAGFAAGQVAALEDAADASDTEWLRFKTNGWGSNEADVQTINFAVWAKDWLRARAAELSKEQHDQPDA